MKKLLIITGLIGFIFLSSSLGFGQNVSDQIREIERTSSLLGNYAHYSLGSPLLSLPHETAVHLTQSFEPPLTLSHNRTVSPLSNQQYANQQYEQLIRDLINEMMRQILQSFLMPGHGSPGFYRPRKPKNESPQKNPENKNNENNGQHETVVNVPKDNPGNYNSNPANKEIIVAVLDTGINAEALIREFGDRIVPGGSGYVDDNGHGTFVASEILGDTKDRPNIKIMPFQILNSEGEGDTFTVGKAIKEAVDKGARVINISAGVDIKQLINDLANELVTRGRYSDRAALAQARRMVDEMVNSMAEAVDHAVKNGTIVVVASGNEGEQSQDTFWFKVQARMRENQNGLVIVDSSETAYSRRYGEIDYANAGEVSAPGSYEEGFDQWGRPARMTGTSMAAPHIAAAIASLWDENPTLSIDEIGEIIKKNFETDGTRRSQDNTFYQRLSRARDDAKTFGASSADFLRSGNPLLPGRPSGSFSGFGSGLPFFGRNNPFGNRFPIW